ncbi:alpha-N-methyltransferase NTM1 [Leucosporidium creatinivorum]|uniref:Alpha N-terminal protein methyltransferase 1 n=1 Tax=Leucosporidium creatinivorum TaxID=106004 RepID=A0A1Y2DJL2_9BASI|nr:alpha-N-methyltransferase NTM1 [Leucosporidium creatinivorum]
MATEQPAQEQKLPVFSAGVEYWNNTDASVNGVLGALGSDSTPVPRLDATSSRLLILSLLPALSTITPPHHTKSSPTPRRSYRALDCGAGIGRVTSTVLLPLFDRVDLVEPVRKFVNQAKRNSDKGKEGWKSLKAGKGVRMWLAGLQFFDPLAPAVPIGGGESELIATVGSKDLSWPKPEEQFDLQDGYDLVMIQWCIGHLSDAQLVEFLKRSRKALREGENGTEGYIMLKENICKDTDGEGAGQLFDDDDSSITRSDKVFRQVFADAGLEIIKREIQQGFPAELFPVVSYALR